jgi:hypothetical protein
MEGADVNHCDFPLCPEQARDDGTMCELHAKVTVTGSWVLDRHGEQGQG